VHALTFAAAHADVTFFILAAGLGICLAVIFFERWALSCAGQGFLLLQLCSTHFHSSRVSLPFAVSLALSVLAAFFIPCWIAHSHVLRQPCPSHLATYPWPLLPICRVAQSLLLAGSALLSGPAAVWPLHDIHGCPGA
jgi:hypothetical protein